MEKIRSNPYPPFLLTAVVLALDQISKAVIVAKWPSQGVFIADLFNNDLVWIIHVRNKAIAFSLGSGLPDGLRTLLFIALPLIVIAGVIVFYLRSSDFSTLQRWLIAGIIGGGVGNLTDRIFRPDGVVDFISLEFFGLFGLDRWPTFNIADASVVICGILLFFSMLLERRTQPGEDRV